MTTLKIKKMRENAILPQRATPGSAGWISAPASTLPCCFQRGAMRWFPPALPLNCQKGRLASYLPAAGSASSTELRLANGVGVIDSDYTGEVCVGLINQFDEPYQIQPGERIAQLAVLPILCPVIEAVDTLTQTQRGAGGFGSTGR